MQSEGFYDQWLESQAQTSLEFRDVDQRINAKHVVQEELFVGCSTWSFAATYGKSWQGPKVEPGPIL